MESKNKLFSSILRWKSKIVFSPKFIFGNHSYFNALELKDFFVINSTLFTISPIESRDEANTLIIVGLLNSKNLKRAHFAYHRLVHPRRVIYVHPFQDLKDSSFERVEQVIPVDFNIQTPLLSREYFEKSIELTLIENEKVVGE